VGILVGPHLDALRNSQESNHNQMMAVYSGVDDCIVSDKILERGS